MQEPEVLVILEEVEQAARGLLGKVEANETPVAVWAVHNSVVGAEELLGGVDAAAQVCGAQRAQRGIHLIGQIPLCTQNMSQALLAK